MGRKRGHDYFGESAVQNNLTYIQYADRLTELAISMFEWKNLPDMVDERYLEMTLFLNGNALFFKDEVIGELALDCTPGSSFDVYGNPTLRRAYSRYNSYHKLLKWNNSVIIWNNYLRKNSVLDVRMFARRLYVLDRIIDINANAQKTPVLVQGTDKQRLTLLNLYKEFDGNAPVIFGDKNFKLDGDALKVLTTGAPFVADKIYQLKTQYWNEALTYLGISNVNVQKKERMITDEVNRGQGGTIASRYSRLQARRDAAKKINKMFNLNIEVNYREDFVPEVDTYSEEEDFDKAGDNLG